MNLKHIASVAIVASSLVGCGGSDDELSSDETITYEGKSAPYSLTGNEDATLGTSLEMAYLGLYSQETGYMHHEGFQDSANQLSAALNEYSQIILNEVGTATIPSTSLSGNCSNPGSVSVNGNYNNFSLNATSYCESLDNSEITMSGGATFVFENDINTLTFTNFSLQVDESMVSINGQIIIDESGESLITSVIGSLTINGKAYPVNMSSTCVSETQCTYDLTYIGADAKTYKIEDLSEQRDDVRTLLTGKLYLPDYGILEFGALDVSICENWTVGAGRLGLNDGERFHTLIYSGCDVEPTIDSGVIIFL